MVFNEKFKKTIENGVLITYLLAIIMMIPVAVMTFGGLMIALVLSDSVGISTLNLVILIVIALVTALYMIFVQAGVTGTIREYSLYHVEKPFKAMIENGKSYFLRTLGYGALYQIVLVVVFAAVYCIMALLHLNNDIGNAVYEAIAIIVSNTFIIPQMTYVILELPEEHICNTKMKELLAFSSIIAILSVIQNLMQIPFLVLICGLLSFAAGIIYPIYIISLSEEGIEHMHDTK